MRSATRLRFRPEPSFRTSSTSSSAMAVVRRCYWNRSRSCSPGVCGQSPGPGRSKRMGHRVAGGPQGQDHRRGRGACDRLGSKYLGRAYRQQFKRYDRKQPHHQSRPNAKPGGRSYGRIGAARAQPAVLCGPGLTHGTEPAAPADAGARSGHGSRAPIRMAAGAGQARSPSPTASNARARTHSYLLHAR